MLLEKLELLTLRWFKSYLADRHQSGYVYRKLSETHQNVLGAGDTKSNLFNIYINSLPTAVEKSRMILYADDAVLIYSATTPLKLNKILQRDFSLISDWYTYNRLTLNVKKTKTMFVGSKTTLSKFEDFDFALEGRKTDCHGVSSFKYLGVIMGQTRNWK